MMVLHERTLTTIIHAEKKLGDKKQALISKRRASRSIKAPLQSPDLHCAAVFLRVISRPDGQTRQRGALHIQGPPRCLTHWLAVQVQILEEKSTGGGAQFMASKEPDVREEECLSSLPPSFCHPPTQSPSFHALPSSYLAFVSGITLSPS